MYRQLGMIYKKGPDEIANWTPFQQWVMMGNSSEHSKVLKFDTLSDYMAWRNQ